MKALNHIPSPSVSTCLLLIFSFLFGAVLSTEAQQKPVDLDPTEPFILLTNDQLLRKDEFYFETSKSGKSSKLFFPNGGPINKNAVKFFQTDAGYFGNIITESKSGKLYSKLVRREEAGTIDIFYEKSRSPEGHPVISYYICKGFGKILPVKYKTLKEAFTLSNDDAYRVQNELILSRLEAAKKRDKNTLVLIGTGVGILAVGGLISVTAGENNSTWNSVGILISAAGLGVAVSPLFLNPNPNELYLSAIREYNEAY